MSGKLDPDKLKEAAFDPQQATSDGQSVRTHSLRDQIELDKHLANRSFKRGYSLSKIQTSGVGRGER